MGTLIAVEVLTSGDLDVWPFQLKIGTPTYSCPVERLYQFSTFLMVFESKPVRDRYSPAEVGLNLEMSY